MVDLHNPICFYDDEGVPQAEMFKHPHGHYVKHSDYEALEATNRELETLYNAGHAAYLAEVKERHAVQAHAQKLTEALKMIARIELSFPSEHREIANEALALTPTSDLSQLREEVREECAKIIDDNAINHSPSGVELRPRYDGDQSGMAYAAAIRARKETGE